MYDNLVAIRTFDHLYDAQPIKIRLESEGIDCIISDDDSLYMGWFGAKAYGGVAVLVKKSDAKRAEEILREE